MDPRRISVYPDSTFQAYISPKAMQASLLNKQPFDETGKCQAFLKMAFNIWDSVGAVQEHAGTLRFATGSMYGAESTMRYCHFMLK